MMSESQTNQQPVASMNGLRVAFDGLFGANEVVRGVSLVVNAGEIVGLIGESGSGKSVTAMTIPRLLPAQTARIISGEVHLNDRDVSGLSEAELTQLRGGEVAVIFQEPMTALNPSMRIGDILVEALRAHRSISDSDARATALAQLEAVQINDPQRVLDAFPFELSGGMRQRIVIALAFMGAPQLIIADEPTTALDVTVQAEILRLIKDMAAANDAAVLFISHDLAVVAGFCDRIAVMKDGLIVEKGETRSILSEPSHPYTKSLLACLPENAEPKSRLPAPGDGAKVAANRSEAVASTKSQPQETLLKVRNVSVRFPTVHDWRGRPTSFVDAVTDASFDLKRGETVSLIGESGSGKTTLARATAGLQKMTSGAALAFDGDPGEAMRSGRMQFVFQDPQSSLNPRMPVWRLITEPLAIAGVQDDLRGLAVELLSQVGLTAEACERYQHQFSGGQRQRLALARALSTRPDVIILDEPTSALDVSVQAQVLNLLLDLQEQLQLTYLIVTHDMSVVRHVSDRVIVMRKGQILEEGPVKMVMESPKSEYTRSLMESTPSLKDALAPPLA